MINFAVCFENTEELSLVRGEILRCFRMRGIEVLVSCYKNACELLECVKKSCPDVMFYDACCDGGLMATAAKSAKRINKNLISVVTMGKGFEDFDNRHFLEPVYIMPSKTRRDIWTFASISYDAYKNDLETFSYYVRPDYINIPVRDVIYFASEGRRTHIVSRRFRDTFYQKLDETELLIKPKNAQFVRIHKSYLVNTFFISCYNRDFVTLKSGEKLRISNYNYYKMLNLCMQDLAFGVYCPA